MSENLQTVTIDWGSEADVAAGLVPEHPVAVSVNGVRYEPVPEVVEEPERRKYLVRFLRGCSGAADLGELGVQLGRLLVNGDLMREAADLLEESAPKIDRLRAAYEETKQRETVACQTADAAQEQFSAEYECHVATKALVDELQGDLEQREAAIGRAMLLLHAVWRDSQPGACVVAASVRGRGATVGSWRDVQGWVLFSADAQEAKKSMKVVLHDGQGQERVVAGEAPRLSIGLGNMGLEGRVRIFDDETLKEIARQIPGRGWTVMVDSVVPRPGRYFKYCEVE